MTEQHKDQDYLEQPMLPFEIQPIALDTETQAKRGWNLEVNGEPVDEVASAKLKHDAMGVEVSYGKRPEGYDGFVIREPGGAATLPYMIDQNGGIFVGVVKEFRPTMGETETQNIPRGFSDFDESKEQTAVRELSEETGYRAFGSRLITLATGVNPNSTFFDYSQSREAGVSLFALPVRQNELELEHDERGNVYYAFPEHIREQAEGDMSAERILGSKFIPLSEALQSRDMFTSAAAGQLTGHLLAQGEYLLPQKAKV